MKRDVVYIPIENNTLVISVDNIGAVGLKEHDVIKASYEDIGYYCARTALVENITAGGKPLSLHLANFCNEEWNSIIDGINKAQQELGIDLVINGSSESNFQMIQSGIGITCVGLQRNKTKNARNIEYAVIGHPLVGPEVLEKSHLQITLKELKELYDLEYVSEILPVGSKGILQEFKYFKEIDIECDLDINKSGGPSTAVIVSYDASYRDQLSSRFTDKFHLISKCK